MKFFAPSYYKRFKCIAEKCKNNCCIGWEIDIDDKTLSFYKSKPDIATKISFSDTPHFALRDNGRCPFLGDDNLCKIIKEYGDGALCQICSDHPRFFTNFDSRTELGIGLACEAAADLILDNDFSLTLINETNEKATENREEYELLNERDLLLSLNFDAYESFTPNITKSQAYELLFSLERLNTEWDNRIDVLKNDNTPLCIISNKQKLFRLHVR
jgi:lysine-N-methylase